jgi:hypothetical protein
MPAKDKNKKDKALVSDTFILKKSPGKGGWTYVLVPGDFKVNKQAFGLTRVKGSIDNYEFENAGIWSTKTGDFFLPVKAEIRKKIKKEEGDSVKVVLYADNAPPVVPDDFLLCLKEEPAAHAAFQQLSTAAQQECITWIFEAKRDNTRVERMAETINRLNKQIKSGK